MDPSNLQKQREPEEPRFLSFPHLPDDAIRDGKLILNKYSSTITREHDFPGAQVRRLFYWRLSPSLICCEQAMLYAAGVPNREAMKNSPHVGVASVWWEGNPCK